MDVILGQPRRRWPEDEKRAAVAMTFEPGVTVTEVARSLEIQPSMLFSWRKKYRDELGHPAAKREPSFVPVTVDAAPAEAAAAPCAEAGVIEVTFGSAPRVKISGVVDPNIVGAVMAALDRR